MQIHDSISFIDDVDVDLKGISRFRFVFSSKGILKIPLPREELEDTIDEKTSHFKIDVSCELPSNY